MNNRIYPYRRRVKAFKSEEWGVVYITTGGLCDPTEARERKTPVYDPGEHPREQRLKMLGILVSSRLEKGRPVLGTAYPLRRRN